MRIFTVIILLLAVYTVDAQVKFGVYAGGQATDVRYMLNEKKQETELKFGFQIGANMKVPFENRLSFAPAIGYNLRGYKVKFDAPSFPPDSAALNNNTTFHTIELSFLFQYDFTLNDGHWFVRFGPSLDFALFGNEKFDTGTGSVDRKMKFSFGDYGHYLASAIVQFGYEMPNGISIYAHYNYGLTTMNNFDGGPQIGNRAAGITIGKYFAGKR